MQYKKWQHPIRYSGVSKITFKRLIHYILLIIICFIPIHLLSKNIYIDFKYLIDNFAILSIIFFYILLMFCWWLEFKVIWSKVFFIYSLHDNEVPPITAAIVLEICYKSLVLF